MRLRPLSLSAGASASKHAAAAFIALSVLSSAFSAPVLAETKRLETRAGGGFELTMLTGDGAPASILMFEGAGGTFRPGDRGFINKQHDTFVDAGFNVAVFDAPDDRRMFRGGMPPKFRESGLHLRDIAAAVKTMRQTWRKPVWLLGMSMGTKSVAAFAAARPQMIGGVVFMSSTHRPPPGFKAVVDYDLSVLSVPVLAVAHSGDRCRGTPPEGAREIAAKASGSVDAKALFFDGGSDGGRSPCGPGSYHTFTDIEDEVIDGITSFIRKHAR